MWFYARNFYCRKSKWRDIKKKKTNDTNNYIFNNNIKYLIWSDHLFINIHIVFFKTHSNINMRCNYLFFHNHHHHHRCHLDIVIAMICYCYYILSFFILLFFHAFTHTNIYKRMQFKQTKSNEWSVKSRILSARGCILWLIKDGS